MKGIDLVKTKKMKGILAAFALFLLLSGCSNERESLAIAEQYGLAYAPVTIMKNKGFLSDRIEGVEIEWKQMANTASIREAMVAGDLDIGFMAIPPFLIGADKGMQWKIFSGLSEVPVALVSLDEGIRELSDFDESDRIALPQPGSIQHMLLSMEAEKELGDAGYFDERIVTMTHPDGMHALLSKADISGHFTSPPYLFMELENEEAHVVLTGKEAMGQRFTFVVGVSMDEFSRKRPVWEAAFKEALAEAVFFMKENPKEVSAILSGAYGIDEEKIREYITREDMVYTLEINGMEKFHDFMASRGYIDNLGEIGNLTRSDGS